MSPVMVRAAGLILRGMIEPLPIVTSAVACLAVTEVAGTAPTRIMVFAAGGALALRDGRSYRVDLARLAARYKADGLKIPLDINHATEVKAPLGERADPVGWITALEQEGAALYATVEWIDPAAAPALLKSYPYVSPAFPARAGEAQWLKSVALVASPALANQPALAGARTHTRQERSMQTVITALGLAEGASEAECLAAVTRLTTGAVPKSVHDETVARLSAVTAELSALKTAERKARVEAVIEEALSAKKILPAQRDHYVALCATDAGLDAVRALLAAAPVLLGASGLDGRPVPGADTAQLSAEDRVVMAQLGLAEADYRAANGLAPAPTGSGL